MKNKKKQKKGFALLYAILLTGVITVLGLILSNIVTKQIILSSIVRESQLAYYASDSARDCARFWDDKNFFYDVIVGDQPETILNNVFCNESSGYERGNINLPTFLPDDINIAQSYSFSGIVYDLGSGAKKACGKFKFGTDSNDDDRNIIVSFGYNREDCEDNSPRRVERILLSEGAREL